MNGGEGDAHELNGHSQDVDEEKAVQLVVEDDERHADGPDAGKTWEKGYSTLTAPRHLRKRHSTGRSTDVAAVDAVRVAG